MFASESARRSAVGAVALLIALGISGCAGGGTDTSSPSASAASRIPRPVDGNCTYVTAAEASTFLGRTVTPRTVDAAPSDVDRCDYSAGATELSYSVSYYDDQAGATRAFAAAAVGGESAGIGDESSLAAAAATAKVVFRWGPFLVITEVTGSTAAPADVARRIAADIRARLG